MMFLKKFFKPDPGLKFAEEAISIKEKIDASMEDLSGAFDQIKEYQFELERAKDLWKSTFDSVETGLAILDKDSKIVKANKAFLEILNKGFEEIEGEVICKEFCGVELEPVWTPCLDHCSQEYIKRKERIFKIKFNQIINIQEEILGCVFVAIDVTEESRIQHHLAELSNKYKGIFNAAKDAIILIDYDRRVILEVNPAASRMYEYSLNEFLSLPINEITAEPRETNQAFESKVESIPLRFHRRKSGTIFPVEISASYFTIDKITYVIAIIRDLSDKLSSEAVDLCLQKLIMS